MCSAAPGAGEAVDLSCWFISGPGRRSVFWMSADCLAFVAWCRSVLAAESVTRASRRRSADCGGTEAPVSELRPGSVGRSVPDP